MSMISSNSSLIKEYGYNEAEWVLAITFKTNGKTYHYQQVPPDVYSAFCAAPSQGSFYNKEIKGQFSALREDDLPAETQSYSSEEHAWSNFDAKAGNPPLRIQEVPAETATEPTPAAAMIAAEAEALAEPAKKAPAIDALIEESKSVMVAAVVVTTEAQYTTVSEGLKKKVSIRDRMFALLDPVRAALWNALELQRATQKKILGPMDESIQADKDALVKYREEQQRLAREEQRRLNEIAAQEAEAERQRVSEQLTLAAAQEAHDRGDTAQVDELFANPIQAAPTPVYAPQVQVAVPRVSGQSTRQTWSAEVTNFEDLILDVAKGIEAQRATGNRGGHAPVTALEANMTTLNQLAKASKLTLQIPGVVAKPKSSMSVGRS